jgi:hypothetical protein
MTIVRRWIQWSAVAVGDQHRRAMPIQYFAYAWSARLSVRRLGWMSKGSTARSISPSPETTSLRRRYSSGVRVHPVSKAAPSSASGRRRRRSSRRPERDRAVLSTHSRFPSSRFASRSIPSETIAPAVTTRRIVDFGTGIRRSQVRDLGPWGLPSEERQRRGMQATGAPVGNDNRVRPAKEVDMQIGLHSRRAIWGPCSLFVTIRSPGGPKRNKIG